MGSLVQCPPRPSTERDRSPQSRLSGASGRARGGRLHAGGYLAVVPVLGAVLLAGCGFAGKDASLSTTEARASLPSMVLPQHAFGPSGRGFEMDGESGRAGNRKAARTSIEPGVTARALARSGRVDGYDVTFVDPRGPRLLSGARPYSLGTEVELFRDEAAASAYLRRLRSDFKRAQGRMRQGVRVIDVDTVDVGGVGEEAVGIRASFATGAAGGFTTSVGFRRGRIVGSATVVQAVEVESMSEMERLAGALDDRINGVMAGEIDSAAVKKRGTAPPRKPDLKQLTLTAKSLSLHMSRTHERDLHIAATDGHFREYEQSRGERLGSSEILYLRTMTLAHESARSALRDQQFLGSRRGSRSIARRLVRGWYRKANFTPRRLRARPLPSPHHDVAAFHLYLDAPAGRFEGVMVSVRRGRFTASATVCGLASKINPRDVVALNDRLRLRLRHIG
jgi:hypothetical protein